VIINGEHYTSVSFVPSRGIRGNLIRIIDQRFLPFQVVFKTLSSLDEVVTAISEMQVRGAPLIGITAAFGLVFAIDECRSEDFESWIDKSVDKILQARPTASNTEYCLRKILDRIREVPDVLDKHEIALETALELMEEDKSICRAIGENGFEIIEELYNRKAASQGKDSKERSVVNILTHCNAGWLACVDYGTVTSIIYNAREKGIDLHVWVDETRPKNQGARLTVWELTQNGVSNTLITDNAGGHLMQKGLVDLVLVGCDRVTRDGDAANKIGTYLKALAAYDNDIPFYVALPSSTIDWTLDDGVKNIPIENRDDREVKYVEGRCEKEIKSVLITEKNATVFNPGFDVTPARYITGFITERGICKANRKEISRLFPEYTSESENN
jgi:methylthioribose-1-phosphate isomerase